MAQASHSDSSRMSDNKGGLTWPGGRCHRACPSLLAFHSLQPRRLLPSSETRLSFAIF